MSLQDSKTRLAAGVLGFLLDSPIADLVERALVWIGHRYPYHFPGRGQIITQLTHRKYAGPNLVATLINGINVSVPPIPEGVALYFAGCLMAEEEEEKLTRLLNRALKAGDVFFDVGANMGFYTFMALGLCGLEGRVYAFEPQPALAECLHESVSLNQCADRVVIEQVALIQTHGGKVTLYLSNNQQSTGIPSILPHGWLDSSEGIEVPAASVDGYLKDNHIDKVDVVKIDVEGAEMYVLHGMCDTFQYAPPQLIILELSLRTVQLSSSGQLRGASALSAKSDEVVMYLARYGYEARRILKDGRLGSSRRIEELQHRNWITNTAFVLPSLAAERPELFGV